MKSIDRCDADMGDDQRCANRGVTLVTKPLKFSEGTKTALFCKAHAEILATETATVTRYFFAPDRNEDGTLKG